MIGDTFGYIAAAVLAALGAFMFLAPEFAMKADKRDDPGEVAKVKKCGAAMIGFAAFAAFLVTKYNLF